MKNNATIKWLLMSLSLVCVMTLASCEKCAHCEYPATFYSDAYQTSSYCHRAGSGKIIYETNQSNCESDGGVWVTE